MTDAPSPPPAHPAPGPAAAPPMLRLRSLGPAARLGVAGAVLTLLGGSAASGLYLALHHDNRDERAGLTIDDIRAHYHGIQTLAPLPESLRAGHPETLDPALRTALLQWIDSPRMSQDYDNLDLGDLAPAEIIAAECLACHTRQSTGPDAAPQIPLEYWDDVRALAVSRSVQPVSMEILAASTHTHALALATLTLVMSALTVLTSWPRRVVGAALALAGLALLADIGSWWLARRFEPAVYVIAGAGALYNLTIILMGLAVLVDLCLPRPRR